MATIRLNNRIKSDICQKAIEKAGINTRIAELKERRAKWAEDVRIQALGGADIDKKLKSIDKRFKKAIADLPEGIASDNNLFRTDYDIYLNIDGCRFYAQFSGNDGDWSRKDRVYKFSIASHTIEAADPLAEEFHAIENEQKSIEDEQATIRANVMGVLEKVATVKRLLETWPEAKELLPADLSPAKSQLPAVKTEDLNAMIGLPTETSA